MNPCRPTTRKVATMNIAWLTALWPHIAYRYGFARGQWILLTFFYIFVGVTTELHSVFTQYLAWTYIWICDESCHRGYHFILDRYFICMSGVSCSVSSRIRFYWKWLITYWLGGTPTLYSIPLNFYSRGVEAAAVRTSGNTVEKASIHIAEPYNIAIIERTAVHMQEAACSSFQWLALRVPTGLADGLWRGGDGSALYALPAASRWHAPLPRSQLGIVLRVLSIIVLAPPQDSWGGACSCVNHFNIHPRRLFLTWWFSLNEQFAKH